MLIHDVILNVGLQSIAVLFSRTLQIHTTDFYDVENNCNDFIGFSAEVCCNATLAEVHKRHVTISRQNVWHRFCSLERTALVSGKKFKPLPKTRLLIL